MKTILYYFTGTGNSLAVARAIAERLPETELSAVCNGTAEYCDQILWYP